MAVFWKYYYFISRRLFFTHLIRLPDENGIVVELEWGDDFQLDGESCDDAGRRVGTGHRRHLQVGLPEHGLEASHRERSLSFSGGKKKVFKIKFKN